MVRHYMRVPRKRKRGLRYWASESVPVSRWRVIYWDVMGCVFTTLVAIILAGEAGIGF